ncbi:MAG: hypothetical protein AB7L92_01670 [Alphaproteobacteria bacterium]
MQKAKEYSIQELEQKYDTIAALYDMAEDLVGTVESDLVKDPQAQLKIVEPLINDIVDATDVLSEEFILIAESKKKNIQSRASKQHIEAALRKLYLAIGNYNKRVQVNSKKARTILKNIADAIVKKIQRQVEEVVVIFLEFIQISLQSLMNKADLDELRLRDARVALMMHQQSLGQHS